MKRILVIQPLRPEAVALLDARTDVTYSIVTDFSEANLLAHVADVDGITIRDAPLPASVIAAAPKLKVVSRHGVGYDNIPVATCTARGIPVTVVGAVNTISVAEQTMLLMLAAARAAVELDASVRRGDFAVRSRVTGLQLSGRTVLVVGLGRIGREVARRCLAFGMRVLAFDPYLAGPAEPGVEVVPSLRDALPLAHVVTLHVPYTDENRHLIGAVELALLPPKAVLVNASRGGLVDEGALVAAVRSGHLFGAGLDTFEREPLPGDSPLLTEPRIVLSPHTAALTDEGLIGMGVMTVSNVLAGLDGNLDPELVVNREVLG